MRLFDRIGFKERAAVDGQMHPLKETYALYALESNAIEAAGLIFGKMPPDQLQEFLYMPLPHVAFEWTPLDAMEFADPNTGNKMPVKTRMCAVMQLHEMQRVFEDQPPMQAVVCNVAVEMTYPFRPGNERLAFCQAHFGLTAVQHNDSLSIPWDYDATAYADGVQFSEAIWARTLNTIITVLAFINSPNLCDAEKVDLSRLNKKRLGSGKTALTEYTVIKPNAHTKQWVRDTRAESSQGPGVCEHWVKAHKHTYLTGPSRTKPIVKLLAPFKRGNPEFGTKEARYVVKAVDSAA